MMMVNKGVNRLIKTGSMLLSRQHNSIFSAAMVIAFTYGVSMVLGILRERLIVGRFYDCCRSSLDVYYAAFRLPDMIFQLVVIGALSAAFIPVFSEVLEKQKEESYRLASSVLNLLLMVFISLCVIVFIFAEPFSHLITGKFTIDQVTLMANMTRLMLIAQVFFLVSNFSAAIIQSHRRFLLPSLSPIVYNLGIVIMVFFFSSTLGVWSAAYGVVLGAIFHLSIQLPLLKKLGFKYFFAADYKSKGVRKVIKLMLPRTLALGASQIGETISLFLATSLAPGSLTLFYLAQRLSDLPVRIVGTSLGQAALPILSNQLAQDKKEEFLTTLRVSLSQVFYFALPITGMFLSLRLQLVRLAYGSKAFPWPATIATGQVMAAMVLSIVSQSIIQLLARAFYAVCDTKTPLFISLFSVGLNLVLSLFFLFGLNMGIFGLALAFTIANLTNFLLLFIFFQLRHGTIITKQYLINWFKMIEASIFASTVVWLSMRFLDKFLDTTRVVPLILLTMFSVSLGIGSYLILSKVLSIPELTGILGVLHRLKRAKAEFIDFPKIDEPASVDP